MTVPSLQLKRRFVESVRTGLKTKTLRARLGGGFEPGARLTLLNGYRTDSVIGHAVIVSVDRVRVVDLTAADAVADGFADELELRAELHRTYPLVDELWRVTWRDFQPRAMSRLA